MIVVVDQLRSKAKSYELNALARHDVGDTFTASLLSTVAITLYEIANALEREERAA